MLANSLYVVYLMEIFKFIPRDQIYVNQLETYSKKQVTRVIRCDQVTRVISDPTSL